MVQWLRLCTSPGEGMGLIPGWGTKILHEAKHGQKEEEEKNPIAYEATGILIQFLWEGKMVESLWETVWQVFIKLNTFF